MNKLYLAENLRNIDVIHDYWMISKECRATYIKLLALVDFISKNYLVIDGAISAPKIKVYHTQCGEIKKQYADVNVVKNIMTSDCEENAPLLEFPSSELFRVLKENLKLICSIDKLRFEILTDVIKNEVAQCNELAKNDLLISAYYMQLMVEYQMEISLNPSIDDDKIYNIILDTKEYKNKKDLLNLGINLPMRLKIKDYADLVKKREKELKHWSIAKSAIIESSYRERLAKLLRENADTQLRINTEIALMTKIMLGLTIVMAILAGVSIYK